MRKGKRGLAVVLAVLLTAATWMPGTQAAGAGLENFRTVQTYTDGQFCDIPQGDKYEESIKTVYELNLMAGSSVDTFNAEENITIANALAMACRLHSIYQTGQADFTQGEPWYQVYVDYGLANGIIEDGQFEDYQKEITREQFAGILAKTLPATALEQKNNVENGAIPDVAKGSRYYDSIYYLYRAGVLTGSDSRGSFEPSSTIQRAEAAAIISRMALPSMRELMTLQVTPVEEVILSERSITLEQGSSMSLSAGILPVNATDDTITWTSSTPSVATVTSRGVVTGFQVGTATITATAHNGVKAKCAVEVKSKPVVVSSISIAQSTLSLAVGEQMPLYYSIKPSNATDRTTKWTTSDSSVATVNSGGTVTARGVGTATITLTSGNGKTDTCRVTVKKAVTASSVSLSPSSVVLETGETKLLKGTIKPSNAGNQNLAWKTSNSAVAKVNADGLVMAVGKGSAVITAKAQNGKYATCRVTVKNPAPPEFSVPEVESNYGPITVASYKSDGSVHYRNDFTLVEFSEPTSQSDNESVYFKVRLEGTSATSKVYVKINLYSETGGLLDSASIGALVTPGAPFELEKTIEFAREALPKAVRIEFVSSTAAMSTPQPDENGPTTEQEPVEPDPQV